MRRPPAQRCLVLAGDAGIGKRIATILGYCRWWTKVVRTATQAYECIQREHYDIVIADIDRDDVGGQAVLAFCHHRFPHIATYAIARADDKEGKATAREAGGCRGYYHLDEGGRGD